MAVVDQQASAVLAKAGVDGKANEITAFAPLLEPPALAGAVITADAMRTQREHAEFLVSDNEFLVSGNKAHYILAMRKNQPSLYAQVCMPKVRGHGSRNSGTLGSRSSAYSRQGLPADR
jgi:hypothetical protein